MHSTHPRVSPDGTTQPAEVISLSEEVLGTFGDSGGYGSAESPVRSSPKSEMKSRKEKKKKERSRKHRKSKKGKRKEKRQKGEEEEQMEAESVEVLLEVKKKKKMRSSMKEKDEPKFVAASSPFDLMLKIVVNPTIGGLLVENTRSTLEDFVFERNIYVDNYVDGLESFFSQKKTLKASFMLITVAAPEQLNYQLLADVLCIDRLGMVLVPKIRGRDKLISAIEKVSVFLFLLFCDFF